MQDKKKVLIFGVNGFAGKELVNELLQCQYDVVGAGRGEARINNVTYVKCDIKDCSQVEQVIRTERPQYVINLAAISSVPMSWENPTETIQTNTIGTINIMEAIRKNDLLIKLLLVGSSEEYALSDENLNECSEIKPRNIYGLSKVWQEQIAKLYHENYGMNVICVRAFNHTGKSQSDRCVIPSFCKQIANIQKSGGPGNIYVGNLNVKRDICDVRDVVRGYRMLLESSVDYGSYNICSGKAHTLQSILELIVSFTQYDVKIEVDKNRVRGIDAAYICGDYTKIHDAIGWKPKYQMDEIVRDIYDYYVEKE